MDEMYKDDPTLRRLDETTAQWLLRMRENDDITREMIGNALASEDIQADDLIDAAANAAEWDRGLATTHELETPDHNASRQVKVTLGEWVRIEDGSHKVYIGINSDENLRVEMIDEEKRLIEVEENNQPEYDNVNAILKTSAD